MAEPCEVWFYHLERTSADKVLPELLEKTLKRGWRAQVRTASPDRVDYLDDWLWRFREEAFLPHGTAQEPMADRQPILLGTDAANSNQAQALFLVDGAEPADLDGYERCIVLFDGRDEAALSQARNHWRQFKAAGLPVSYWQQGEGRGWEKKA